MIVAVVAMGVMQMPVDEIVDVIAMRHRFVAAAGPVDMIGLMTGAAMLRRAGIGIPRRDIDLMLVDVILMRMMQMTVMQIVDMIAMAQRDVTAARTVRMAMIGVMGL